MDDVGGMDSLAALLKVSAADIQAWLSGKSSPGNAEFLQMLDIVSKGPR